jgi:hypothetical protein
MRVIVAIPIVDDDDLELLGHQQCANGKSNGGRILYRFTHLLVCVIERITKVLINGGTKLYKYEEEDEVDKEKKKN